MYQHSLRRLQRLNPTAAAVWAEIDGRRDVSEIAEVLALRYDRPALELVPDVQEVVAEYGNLGLLDGVEATVAPAARIQPPAPQPKSESALADRMSSALDGAAWSMDLRSCQGLGFQFGVRVEDADLGHYLEAVLAPLMRGEHEEAVCSAGEYSVRGPHPRSGAYRIYFGPTRIHSTTSPAASAEFLLWHVNRMVIDADESQTLFHAAGATISTGGGILIPGHMNAGKSTLVAGLVRSGLGYLSDEAIALDHLAGDLVPFPKSIGLDRGSWTVLPEFAPEPDSAAERFQETRWQVPPDVVRSGSVAGRTPLAFIIATRHEPGAETSIDVLAPADALSLLLEQTFGLGDGDAAFHSLAEIVDRTECYQLVSGDLDEAVAAVRRVVGEG